MGRSALYSVLSLVRTLTENGSLANQETQINQPQDAAAFWDLTYQLLGWGFGLVAVARAVSGASAATSCGPCCSRR